MQLRDMNQLPVNTPFYWSVIKSTFDKESAFVEAGNLLMNDVLEAIIAEQRSIDPRTADISSPAVMRFATIRRLTDIDDETSMLDIDKEYLLTKDVMMKHYEDIVGIPTFLGSFDLFYSATRSIAKITDRYYAPDIIMIKDIDYECSEESLRFDVDPIENLLSASNEQIVCPSGAEYNVMSGSFIFQAIEKKNGPLYRDFGSLVYTRDINDTETELEYRRKIVGLMLAYYHGTTNTALEASINTMVGLPVTLYDGELIVSISAGMTHTVVKTDKETYILDNTIPFNTDILIEGTALPAYTPFHSIITIEEGVAPTALSSHLMRVNPYSTVGAGPIAEVYTNTLDLTGEVPLHYSYEMLQNYVGTAGSAIPLDLDTIARSPGDYVRVTANTISLTYSIARGSDTQVYVKGDILYVDPEGHRWERYRNLIYKGEIVALPTLAAYPMHREEYHVFKVKTSPISCPDFDGVTQIFGVGTYFVRDDFAEAYFPLDDVYATEPGPCDSQKQITFDFFKHDIDADYQPFALTGEYKLLPDRANIKEYNTYVWEELIRDAHITIKILIPASGVHTISDLSFLNDIIPLWALYTVDYTLNLSESIDTEETILDEVDVTLL